jgi:hypothetical protein
MPLSQASTRTIAGEYLVISGAIAGTVAAQNLISIENPAASTITLYIKRILISSAATSAASVKFLYRIGRTTAIPTGGTVLTDQKKATSNPAAQGIARLVPTATAATGNMDAVFGPVLQNAASIGFTGYIFQSYSPADDIVLEPGEGLLVYADGNDVDLSHVVSITRQEGSGI